MAQNGEIIVAVDEWWDQLNPMVTPEQSLCYIHRVPQKLRVVGETKYDPHVISIGPYHRDKTLEITDNHKKLYLQSFISRSKAPETMRKDVIEKINVVRDAARKCYAENIKLDDDEFARMLILDGCFILELLYKDYEYKDQAQDQEESKSRENSTSSKQKNKEIAEDILFNKSWIIPSIRRDLVLLENQIHFSVLKCLFDLTHSPLSQTNTPRTLSNSKQSGCFKKLVRRLQSSISGSQVSTPNQPTISTHLSLNELIASFFDPILPTISDYTIDSGISGEHLLDLLRKSLLRQPKASEEKAGSNPFWEHTTCATDLQEAGVNFKKKDESDGLLEITFINGTFGIPPFFFGESWTVLFPNIIALEQCRHDYHDEITSYAILIDNLIDSQNDVKLLRQKGIISGAYKEDETIAQAVNNLCKKAIVGKFYYDGLCYRVNAYRKTTIPTWRAAFMRKVIHTPWAGVSVLAAVTLLGLTITQTVFAVLSWVIAKKDLNEN